MFGFLWRCGCLWDLGLLVFEFLRTKSVEKHLISFTYLFLIFNVATLLKVWHGPKTFMMLKQPKEKSYKTAVFMYELVLGDFGYRYIAPNINIET